MQHISIRKYQPNPCSIPDSSHRRLLELEKQQLELRDTCVEEASVHFVDGTERSPVPQECSLCRLIRTCADSYVVFERGVREYYCFNIFQSTHFLMFQLRQSNYKNISRIAHPYRKKKVLKNQVSNAKSIMTKTQLTLCTRTQVHSECADSVREVRAYIRDHVRNINADTRTITHRYSTR